MDKELTRELRQGDASRIKNIIAEKTGRSLKRSGLRGALWVNAKEESPFIRLVLNVVFKGAIFLILYMLFQEHWFPALLVYATLHVGLFLLGKHMEEKGRDALVELSVYFNERCANYYEEECRKRNIVGDAVLIDNVMIRNGRVEAYIKPTKAVFDLYCLESVDGDVDRFDRRLNPQPGDVDMSKYISSVEFNKKYGIFVKKGMERHCVDLFRPTVQVGMCGKFKFEHLAMVQVSDGLLTAATKANVKPTTTVIDIYEDTLLFVFDDIDRFCEQMEKMGKKYYPEVEYLINGMGLNP